MPTTRSPAATDAPAGRLDDAAQRLVAEDEAVASRRRPPVGARHDLHVGPAHPHGQSLDQDRAVGRRGFVDVFEPGRARRQGLHRQRLHRGRLLLGVVALSGVVAVGSADRAPGVGSARLRRL